MATLQLSNLDARLTFLALQYHLSRPGSELRREPGAGASTGLAGASAALEPQLDKAVATIDLGDEQRERLASAIGGAINELKSTALLQAGGGQSMVPAFRDALHRLFPGAADDPDEAEQLAGHLVALRRRLVQVPPDAPATQDAPKRSGWRFWQRN